MLTLNPRVFCRSHRSAFLLLCPSRLQREQVFAFLGAVPLDEGAPLLPVFGSVNRRDCAGGDCSTEEREADSPDAPEETEAREEKLRQLYTYRVELEKKAIDAITNPRILKHKHEVPDWADWNPGTLPGKGKLEPDTSQNITLSIIRIYFTLITCQNIFEV